MDLVPVTGDANNKVETLTSALAAAQRKEAENAASRAAAEKELELAMEREAASHRERDSVTAQMHARAAQIAATTAEPETRHRDALRRARYDLSGGVFFRLVSLYFSSFCANRS